MGMVPVASPIQMSQLGDLCALSRFILKPTNIASHLNSCQVMMTVHHSFRNGAATSYTIEDRSTV